MKSAKQYLDEANEVVIRIPADEAIKIHAEGNGVFIDVRDSGAERYGICQCYKRRRNRRMERSQRPYRGINVLVVLRHREE